MAIQNRRGFYDKFDPSRLVAGEWAIVLDGDKNAPDGKSAYVCFAAGNVKRVALFEDMSTNIKKANSEIIEELTTATNNATQKATETTEKCENTIKKSEETTAATIAAKEDCIQATQACKTSTEQSQNATQETKDATNACNAATSESKASTQTATETLEKLNTSESARADAEKVRVENENTRISNEQKRVSDESERASAEQTRKSNEDERLTHENTRLDAERVRVGSENIRAKNEKARAEAEQTRWVKETERINNEKMRVESENTRKNEEETRSNNEKARIEKENNRLTDEEKRVSAEKERAEKENSRISAEETRVSNESARVDEENSRKLRFKEMIDAAQNVKFKVLEDNQVNEKGVPTIEGTAGVIYLVKDKKSNDTNHYIEWFYYNNKWEIFGTTNASMDEIPLDLLAFCCGNGYPKLEEWVEKGKLSYKFDNTRVLKERNLLWLCNYIYNREQVYNKQFVDHVDLNEVKWDKADKSELEKKADKETVEQLKKDKADKSELATLKQTVSNTVSSKIQTLEQTVNNTITNKVNKLEENINNTTTKCDSNKTSIEQLSNKQSTFETQASNQLKALRTWAESTLESKMKERYNAGFNAGKQEGGDKVAKGDTTLTFDSVYSLINNANIADTYLLKILFSNSSYYTNKDVINAFIKRIDEDSGKLSTAATQYIADSFSQFKQIPIKQLKHLFVRLNIKSGAAVTAVIKKLGDENYKFYDYNDKDGEEYRKPFLRNRELLLLKSDSNLSYNFKNNLEHWFDSIFPKCCFFTSENMSSDSFLYWNELNNRTYLYEKYNVYFIGDVSGTTIQLSEDRYSSNTITYIKPAYNSNYYVKEFN